MAITKLSQEVLDLNPGNPDYVLDSTNAVTVINAGGNQYNFNGVYGKFGAKIGTITLTGVPSGHPIAFINSGKTSQISYTGTVDEGTATGPDGNTYTFYSGTVTLTVSADFGTISYYCKIHGYMGGQDNLVYTYSDSGLKIPSGTELNRPTAVAGMVRNNTNESSESSNSCEEYYNSTAWQKINNVALPPPPVHFGAKIYTGNGSTNAISGFGFRPDWIVLKNRSNSASNTMSSSNLGRGGVLYLNGTSQLAPSPAGTDVASYDSDGFTLGTNNNGNINTNGDDYVAWCWQGDSGNTSTNSNGTITSTVQVNSAAGFSSLTYTGNATGNQTIGHGLSSAPELILIKSYTDGTVGWLVFAEPIGNTKYLILNAGDAEAATSAAWENTSPTSSVFTIGTASFANNSGQSYIAFCFHSVAGYSKIGSYSGTGSLNTVTVGFTPSFVVIKRTDSTGGWLVFDNARNTSNPRNSRLEWNNSSAETSGSATKFVNFNTNDFQVGGSDSELNATGGTYVYATFR